MAARAELARELAGRARSRRPPPSRRGRGSARPSSTSRTAPPTRYTPSSRRRRGGDRGQHVAAAARWCRGAPARPRSPRGRGSGRSSAAGSCSARSRSPRVTTPVRARDRDAVLGRGTGPRSTTTSRPARPVASSSRSSPSVASAPITSTPELITPFTGAWLRPWRTARSRSSRATTPVRCAVLGDLDAAQAEALALDQRRRDVARRSRRREPAATSPGGRAAAACATRATSDEHPLEHGRRVRLAHERGSGLRVPAAAERLRAPRRPTARACGCARPRAPGPPSRRTGTARPSRRRRRRARPATTRPRRSGRRCAAAVTTRSPATSRSVRAAISRSQQLALVALQRAAQVAGELLLVRAEPHAGGQRLDVAVGGRGVRERPGVLVDAERERGRVHRRDPRSRARAAAAACPVTTLPSSRRARRRPPRLRVPGVVVEGHHLDVRRAAPARPARRAARGR